MQGQFLIELKKGGLFMSKMLKDESLNKFQEIADDGLYLEPKEVLALIDTIRSLQKGVSAYQVAATSLNEEIKVKDKEIQSLREALEEVLTLNQGSNETYVVARQALEGVSNPLMEDDVFILEQEKDVLIAELIMKQKVSGAVYDGTVLLSINEEKKQQPLPLYSTSMERLMQAASTLGVTFDIFGKPGLWRVTLLEYTTKAVAKTLEAAMCDALLAIFPKELKDEVLRSVLAAINTY
jgi:hypothetical protein